MGLYACSFAGVSFCLDAPDVLAEIAKIPLADLRETCPVPRWPGHRQGGLAFPQWPARPDLRVGQLHYPSGASRWAEFHGLATRSQANAMKQAAWGGGVPLEPKAFALRCDFDAAALSDTQARGGITTPLYLLACRPLAYLPGAQLNAYQGEPLYLVTLVDERYYWQFRPVTLRPDDAATWSDLIDDCTAALLIDLDYDAPPDVYGVPAEDSDLWASAGNAALLLDALAWNVGQFVVRKWDGIYEFQSAAEADITSQGNRATDLVRLAGGDPLDDRECDAPGGTYGGGQAVQAVLPAAVVVTFPKFTVNDDFVDTRDARDHNRDGYGDVYEVTVTLLEAGYGYPYVGHPGSKVIHDTARAYYDDAGLLNDDELQALAVQLAKDFYAAQLIGLDEVYPGVRAWTPDGANDLLFTYRGQFSSTRAQRKPWNFGVSEMSHQFTDFGPGTGGGGDGLCSGGDGPDGHKTLTEMVNSCPIFDTISYFGSVTPASTPVTIFLDHFTGADGDLLDGRTPDTGGVWVGNGGGWKIGGNKATVPVLAQENLALADVGYAFPVVTLNFVVPDSVSFAVGAVVRASDADNLWYAVYEHLPGSAIVLDQLSSQYVSMGDVAALAFDGTQAFSITAWVKTTSGDEMAIVTKADNGHGYRFFCDHGPLSAVMRDGINGMQREGTTHVNDGSWHSVAMTYDGSGSAAGIHLYVDGVEDTYTTTTLPTIGANPNTYDFRIGAVDEGTPLYFNGTIDEAQVYDTVLSGATITANYNGGDGTTGLAGDAGLVAGWHFDEGTGATAKDYKGSINGVLHNGVTWADGRVRRSPVVRLVKRVAGMDSDEFSQIYNEGVPAAAGIHGLEIKAEGDNTITVYVDGVAQGAVTEDFNFNNTQIGLIQVITDASTPTSVDNFHAVGLSVAAAGSGAEQTVQVQVGQKNEYAVVDLCTGEVIDLFCRVNPEECCEPVTGSGSVPEASGSALEDLLCDVCCGAVPMAESLHVTFTLNHADSYCPCLAGLVVEITYDPVLSAAWGSPVWSADVPVTCGSNTFLHVAFGIDSPTNGLNGCYLGLMCDDFEEIPAFWLNLVSGQAVPPPTQMFAMGGSCDPLHLSGRTVSVANPGLEGACCGIGGTIITATVTE